MADEVRRELWRDRGGTPRFMDCDSSGAQPAEETPGRPSLALVPATETDGKRSRRVNGAGDRGVFDRTSHIINEIEEDGGHFDEAFTHNRKYLIST